MSRPRYSAPRLPDAEKPEIQVLEDLEPEDGIRSITAEAAAKDMRLDAYLAKAIPDISRARVTLLIDNGQVTPVISRTYAFSELREAVAYQEQGHVPAKVAVTV